MTESIERTEYLVPGSAEALAGLLGVALPDIEAGGGLPLLWHWVYLLERPAHAVLGRDGHPMVGGLPSPPGPDQRRMFAGGRVTSHAPLRVGRLATRRSAVLSSTDKQGSSGRLRFVTVGYEISQDGRLALTEEQDIVYRDAVAVEPAGEPVVAGPGTDVPPDPDEWSLDPDPVRLFRFSALTYNAHRIHYDRDYARDVEGYPGLVVHGPLQALAMAEAARRLLSRDAQRPAAGRLFSFRLRSPLFDNQGMLVRARRGNGQIDTRVRDQSGRVTARGYLTG